MQNQPFDINAYIQAMMQIAQQQQQGRTQMHREEASGRHLGMGGADISESNPTGNAGNPFNNGFFNSTAAQMTPEARLASQGNNATNQWAQLGQVSGVDPANLTAMNNMAGGMSRMNPHPTSNFAQDVSNASPMPYTPMQGAFNVPPPLTSPEGNAGSDKMNFDQNYGMAQNPRNFFQPPHAVFGAPAQQKPQPQMPYRQVSGGGFWG